MWSCKQNNIQQHFINSKKQKGMKRFLRFFVLCICTTFGAAANAVDYVTYTDLYYSGVEYAVYPDKGTAAIYSVTDKTREWFMLKDSVEYSFCIYY